MTRRASPPMNGLAGILAVLAVFVRVLFPGGYMLADADGSGRPAIVICTGEGMKTLVADPGDKVGGSGDAGAPHSTHDGGLCPYAAAGAPGIAPAAPAALGELALAPLALLRPCDSASDRRSIAAIRPPPTGPPVRV